MNRRLALSAAMAGIFLLKTPAHAGDWSCPAAQVSSIQIQNDGYLILLAGQGWKRLGSLSGELSQSRLAMALTAQAQQRNLILIFESNDTPAPDCNANQYGTVPIKVKLSLP